MAQVSDRVTRLWVRDFLGVHDAALDLTRGAPSMTALIGGTGSGKSSMIEALEVLSRAPRTDLASALDDHHGGLGRILRHGAAIVTLGVDADLGEAGVASYEISLAQGRYDAVVKREEIVVDGEVVMASGPVTEDGSTLLSLRGHRSKLLRGPAVPAVAQISHLDPIVMRLAGVLTSVAVRRSPSSVDLAAAYSDLRSRDSWPRILEDVQLVVGVDVADVTFQRPTRTTAGATPGLTLTYRGGVTVPERGLSDGTRALLGLVALARLPDRDHPRSVLAVDDPELHLGPGKVGYASVLLEECSRQYPVLIATQHEQVLDDLPPNPGGSVVLCRVDDQRQVRLARPVDLDDWVERYRRMSPRKTRRTGLGELYTEGWADLIFP